MKTGLKYVASIMFAAILGQCVMPSQAQGMPLAAAQPAEIAMAPATEQGVGCSSYYDNAMYYYTEAILYYYDFLATGQSIYLVLAYYYYAYAYFYYAYYLYYG